MTSVPDETPTVYIIDDDRSVRDGLDSLLRSVGYTVRGFASGREFGDHRRAAGPACLVLDVRMPGQSGLDFQEQLARASDHIPIVFLTGYGDVAMTARAFKGGAVDFLLKPFREQDLLDAIQVGVVKDRERLGRERRLHELRTSFSTLSPRECEVMSLVVRGLLNKQIATELRLSEITVKVHRGQAMRKMQAHTLADLIVMADKLGVTAGSMVY